eukprot:CAMPEP_0197522430 /NCGR_PEP_ID=MMETSP1318-20131121/7580_1 /TAXON_ID=552666 /ORGANISM="Partenskyella glossopodia, Strain RCC365" /LENGTH=355 /DNA_ID=CAMNT_0043074815 /DNA_START=34 /DNA_END=1101 /DNA_ORIENTATION=-
MKLMSRALTTFLIVGLSVASPVSVSSIPDNNGGIIVETTSEPVVVEISGTLPFGAIGGGGFPDLDVISNIVDAMLAPIVPALEHHSHRGSGSGFLFPFPGVLPVLTGNMKKAHSGRHGIFSSHSSVMRHPTVGHCHQDREKLCEVQSHGQLHDLFEALSCLAENKHKLSHKCKETVTVHAMPCLSDLKKHCNTSAPHSNLAQCIGDNHHKLSDPCSQTLSSAAAHRHVVPVKVAPQPEQPKQTVTPASEAILVSSEPKAPEEEKKSPAIAASEEISLSAKAASMFQAAFAAIESNLKFGFILLGAIVVAVAAFFVLKQTNCTKSRKKEQHKRKGVKFGRMLVEAVEENKRLNEQL